MFAVLRRIAITHSTPEDAHAAQRRGGVLIDVRELHEWQLERNGASVAAAPRDRSAAGGP